MFGGCSSNLRKPLEKAALGGQVGPLTKAFRQMRGLHASRRYFPSESHIMPTDAPHVAVIGGGPAGLMAAERLGRVGIAVTVYDRMPSLGRKLLMAGRGGLNLTHSEPLDAFLLRYSGARPRLEPVIQAFPPAALREWCENLGQETFVGSSGRVFPKAFKASPLLRAWLARLRELGVQFALRHRWSGWDASGQLLFSSPEGETRARPDATILALGGASWPKLGSDGAWADILRAHDIELTPLQPANMGFVASWSNVFRERFEGEPLKRVAFSFGGQSVRGEAIVTSEGIEGGAVYALSAALRNAILESGEAVVSVDLRPDLDAAALTLRLSAKRNGQSTSNFLKKAAGLSPVAIGLMREAVGPNLPASAPDLASLIKNTPLRLIGSRPIERAISTAGGVSFDEIDASLMLKRKPGVFVAGEMLDWEAPTGGYLLQACFATGLAAANGTLAWLGMRGSSPMSH